MSASERNMNMKTLKITLCLAIIANLITGLVSCTSQKIDREALVKRNNPHVTVLDPLNSLNLGNGEFTLTLDATGLQTFPEFCKDGLSLGTYSEWCWHSFPNTEGYSIEETYEEHPLPGHSKGIYAVQVGLAQSERSKAAASWFRSNPHRVHLGNVGFEGMQPSEIDNVDQTLDMWNGMLHSKFTWNGVPVEVRTVNGGQQDDQIAASVTSQRPIPVTIRFPYPTGANTDDASNWDVDEKHSTEIVSSSPQTVLLKRTIDSVEYYVSVAWSGNVQFQQNSTNRFTLIPENGNWNFCVRFEQYLPQGEAPDFKTAASAAKKLWNDYWNSTAVVDFSHCTNEQAPLLERKVVLSQYLMRVQEAQNFPPAETGMTYNSWHGKFHLEMVMWHSFHYGTWNQPELLRKQLAWYKTAFSMARNIAERQGFEGIRWMKMTDPTATEAPSDIGSYIIWQQPHPIYMAELIYRAQPSAEFIEKYYEIVQQTAAFMASFVNYDKENDRYIIEGACAATESLSEDYTVNPAFELSYWHFGLSIAQQWRERKGEPRNPNWDDILAKLSTLSTTPEGIYLPAEQGPGIPDYQNERMLVVKAAPAPPGGYVDGQRGRTSASYVPLYDEDGKMRARVSGTSTENLLAYGMLPACRLFNKENMLKTLELANERWSWDRGNFSWNYPSLALNATRLGRPDIAVRAVNMNNRSDLLLPSGNNYRSTTLRMYLPGNGGILLAVGMMCAGWDGCTEQNPGFPKDGTWDVRWEGLKPLP